MMSGSENLNSGPVVRVVALAMKDSGTGHIMLARRGPAVSGAGHWEFPGGKIEPGENSEQALRREILEELSFDLGNLKITYIGENTHRYGTRDILIKLFMVSVASRPQFKLVDHDQVDWFDAESLEKLNLSSGDKPFIPLLF